MTQLRSHESHLTCIDEQGPSGSYLFYRSNQNWREGLSVHQASIYTALKISERYKPPYLIPMSGGIDSEFLALAFINANIPFTPVIMKFTGEYNDFDTANAIRFCKKNKLEAHILMLDLDNFFSKEMHLQYAEGFCCRSPQLATHLWMMEQIEGTFVFPYNPLPLFTNSLKKLFIAFPLKLYHCYDIFLDKNQRDGVGNFHTYTADMIYSFLQLPLYLEMLFNSEKFFQIFGSDNYFTKCELYREGGIQVVARKYKATGFEIYRKYLNEKFNSPLGSDYFDVHYRKPMELISRDNNLQAYGDVDLKRLYSIWTKQ